VHNTLLTHYTQVVWANSRYLGCAVHRCGKVAAQFVTTGLEGITLEQDHTRRDRRVQSAPMELDGARTICATRIVQELERIVCAPRSATTVQS